jgi:CubicO group peptidase (beta-lactamase class C family)
VGLDVAVVRDGRVLLEKQYGFQDLAHTKPLAPGTVFEIGSLTKQFTAAAILTLVDAGKVALDAPVSRYLPGFAPPVTIAQLLNQTSGLPDYARPENLGKDADGIVAAIAAAPSDFAPGTQWEYSNSNYFILGRVVERVSGESYADYVSAHVLTPAGMSHTTVCPADGAGRAQGSFAAGAAGSAPASAPVVDPSFYGGAGDLCSTTADLLAWQVALFGGKVVSARSLSFMTTAPTLGGGAETSYGAGLVMDAPWKHRRIWHNGAVPSGFESELSFYPDDHLQIVLLTNTLHDPPSVVLGGLDSDLAEVALGIPASASTPVDLPLDDDDAARDTGVYATEGVSVRVYEKDGGLRVTLPGGRDTALLNQGGDTFVLEANPNGAYHFVGPSGAPATTPATTIDLTLNGAYVGRLSRVTDDAAPASVP